jgi:hypothetical protein
MAATGSPLDRAIDSAALPKCLATRPASRVERTGLYASGSSRAAVHARPALNRGIQKAEEFGQ